MNDRADPDRMIEWTGERFVPWGPDIPVAYEHLHRYHWAAELARDLRVLDLGSGEGYGSAILASVATSVLGVDLDERSIEHSRRNHVADNLEFAVGSAEELGFLESGSFDLVVGFEVIEHLHGQQQMVAEVKRVLRPGGLFVLSTPIRRTHEHAVDNPFHVRELTREELEPMLAERFAHTRIWGQRTIAGSRLAQLDERPGAAGPSFHVQRVGDHWIRRDSPDPVYLVAVASDAEPASLPGDSTLLDPGLELVHAERRERELVRRERDAAIADADSASREVVALRFEADRLYKWGLRAQAETLHPSVRAFRALRRAVLRVFGGERSRLSRAVHGAILVTLNVARRRAWDQDLTRRIGFARPETPIASLVIPVHSHPGLTADCLRSIFEKTAGVPYEVIVVDDTADRETSRLIDSVRGARVVRNESNLGFTASVNRGAAVARGRYVVVCNNDIAVREGWLDALIDCARSAPDIGVVAPKFLSADGSVSEAGGIVFDDGTAANFGRGDYQHDPIYNYRREVDYGSAAALLVTRELWEAVGGFDERYSPGFYEDTDLCFAAREHGKRVMYEPAAEVVHKEGSTMGADPESGLKRHQEAHRHKFVAKWGRQLERQRPHPLEIEDVRRARDRAFGDLVLVFDHRIPAPDVDAGSVRMLHILKALRSRGCSVTFVPENLLRWEPYCRRLQELGIEVLYERTNLYGAVSERAGDARLAILSRPTTAMAYVSWVRQLAPQATLAYDTVDLHFVREGRRAEFDPQAERVARSMREVELGLIRACDVTICVSEMERLAVLREVPEAAVGVISNAHEARAEAPSPDGRTGLVFVGGFEHTPNIDAVRYLVDEIMPLVWRRLGDVELRIVGARPTDEVSALASDRVTVTGWVEEIEPELDSARAMVAPLRYGAGVKGKITQSLALGLPVVTTTIGAEGIDAADGRELMIADDPSAFVDRVVRLYTDDQAWRQVSRGGLRLARSRFSVDAITEGVDALLNGSFSAPTAAPARTRTTADRAGFEARARRTQTG